MGQVFYTVLAGVLVFVTGQLALTTVIQPILAIRRAIGRVAWGIHFYANTTGYMDYVESQDFEEATKFWRDQASRLYEVTYGLPLYGLWSRLHLVAPESAVTQASRLMIGLSNLENEDPDRVGEYYQALQVHLDFRA